MTEAAAEPMSQDATPSQRQPLVRAVSETLHFSLEFSRDNPGRLADFYTVGSSRLGEGSFGSAHSAVCKRTGAKRAVKSIEVQNVRNPTRFEKEIAIAKQLDHPNVVRLYETFRDARKIYLVMELCTGGELFDRIVAEGTNGFDELKAARYVQQILGALAYLHAHRFAHRDVKPENFLFHSEAADSALKIIDFGLACHYEPGVPMSTKAGTAYYVAPEVLNGAYDQRCDIWSAGVITFILLCGYPPFSGETDPEILRKVKAGTFEFRSPEWDLISQGAKNLVTQMLTVDPTLRPCAEALLAFPWLRFKGTPAPAAINTDFVSRLQTFRASSKLKKVALAIIAQQLPDEEVESLQSIFKGLDKNADGMLSAEEVRQGMLQHGLKVPQHLDDLLRSVDCNGSGQLDYTEFLATMIDKKVYMQRDVCWAAFRIFDLDGDGKITREELGKVLNGDSVKEALGASKIEKMIREVDLDGDGAIDFEEFCAMMASRGRAAGASAAASAGAREAPARDPPAAKRAKKGAAS